MNPRASSAFTLVELMVVIAVIAIMASIATPAVLGSLPGMRTNGAARQVMSDLRLARTMAVEKGASSFVTFATDGTYTVWVDLDGDSTQDSAEVEKTVDLDGDDYNYRGVALDTLHNSGDAIALNGTADAISFAVNGTASKNGSIYLMPAKDKNSPQNHDRNRRVRVVAATGNMRIESWEGSTWE